MPLFLGADVLQRRSKTRVKAGARSTRGAGSFCCGACEKEEVKGQWDGRDFREAGAGESGCGGVGSQGAGCLNSLQVQPGGDCGCWERWHHVVLVYLRGWGWGWGDGAERTGRDSGRREPAAVKIMSRGGGALAFTGDAHLWIAFLFSGHDVGSCGWWSM